MKGLSEIGKIVKIHGLKGALKVNSYLESDAILTKLKEVHIGLAKGPESFRIKRVRFQKKGFLIELEGIENAEAAERLVGSDVLIASDQFEALPEGEYYWKDLIGLEVWTEEGEYLGKIESIFPTGSNDVYICRGAEREILLPVISEVIRDIDLKKGKVLVKLLEGL